MELSERAQHLLQALVDRYIQGGQPVGSRALAEASGLSLSPATVRNVMADLEARGYLTSPHTSAGRVPTAQAYRYFVNRLLTTEALERLDPALLDERLDPTLTPRELVHSASRLLASLTRQAGLVMLPRQTATRLQRVEFLPLNENRVLVVLVLQDQEVQNRVIHTDKPYDREDLQRAANYINEHWAGHDLNAVREGLLASMQRDRQSINRLMASMLTVAQQALAREPVDPDYVVSGESHLLEQAEPGDMGRLRELFQAFEHKQDILHLMDRCARARGVQIFIGEESGHTVFDDFSVITAPYETASRRVGVLGIIGPTRMPYDQVIPVVDMTARLLGAALNPDATSGD